MFDNMLLLLIVMLIILISVVWPTYWYGIGPTPTSFKVKTALFEMLPKIHSGIIYELGAGWGTLAFPLAERYSNIQVIAIEVSPLPWLWMHIRLWLTPKSNLKILYGNFLSFPLVDAALIVCYLCPKAMKELAFKLDQEEVKALILSHTFALPGKCAGKIFYASDLYNTPLYIYGNNE